jgi:hypothetical protein
MALISKQPCGVSASITPERVKCKVIARSIRQQQKDLLQRLYSCIGFIDIESVGASRIHTKSMVQALEFAGNPFKDILSFYSVACRDIGKFVG